MADFSLISLFVVPVGNSLPSSGSTQDLSAGQFGIFKSDYSVATAGDITSKPYFYVAQGRINTYLQGSKRSDKIAGCPTGQSCKSNVTEWYKVKGCGEAAVQITEISDWNVKCGDEITITLRGHSSYLDSLYFNGFTRSVTIKAPCCDCDTDPCSTLDSCALVDQFIDAFTKVGPGNNPDNVSFSKFYDFEKVVDGADCILRISGKPLNKYGQPCDVAAFPHEYDRMWFRTFVYAGPATTADFIVADACELVAVVTVKQRSSYATGTAEEIKQLEKNYHSYQAGYLKHLYRMGGYNANFESWVSDGTIYDTYYVKFNDYYRAEYVWGDYIKEDSMVIIAVPQALSADIEAILVAGLGPVVADNECITTTSTTSAAPASTTTSTTTLIP